MSYVLINNAGYGLYRSVEDVSEEEVWRQIDTNLIGRWRLLQAVLPSVRAQGSGKIVNVSSTAGRLVGPLSGMYSASKHAVEGMSEALRFRTPSHRRAGHHCRAGHVRQRLAALEPRCLRARPCRPQRLPARGRPCAYRLPHAGRHPARLRVCRRGHGRSPCAGPSATTRCASFASARSRPTTSGRNACLRRAGVSPPSDPLLPLATVASRRAIVENPPAQQGSAPTTQARGIERLRTSWLRRLSPPG